MDFSSSDEESEFKSIRCGKSDSTRKSLTQKLLKTLPELLFETFGVESMITVYSPGIHQSTCRTVVNGYNLKNLIEKGEGEDIPGFLLEASKSFSRPDPRKHAGYREILLKAQRSDQIEREMEACSSSPDNKWTAPSQFDTKGKMKSRSRKSSLSLLKIKNPYLREDVTNDPVQDQNLQNAVTSSELDENATITLETTTSSDDSNDLSYHDDPSLEDCDDDSTVGIDGELQELSVSENQNLGVVINTTSNAETICIGNRGEDGEDEDVFPVIETLLDL